MWLCRKVSNGTTDFYPLFIDADNAAFTVKEVMMSKRFIIIILMLRLCTGLIWGQYRAVDVESPQVIYHYRSSSERFISNPVIRQTAIPAMFFSLSALTYNSGDHYLRDIRNSHISHFDIKYDDYTQFAPGVFVFGAKLLGLEGKSSWHRLLSATSASTVMNVAGVQLIKTCTSKTRPNNSDDHSFPSGHTAFAFMTATWMHHEYADQSIYYSIAGYSIAAATAIGRYINNRHWISDILAGAGIGILTGNLGYSLADLISGYSPPLYTPTNINTYSRDFSNTFVRFNAGYSLFCNEMGYKDIITPDARNGFTASGEGAWFFSENFGLGGMVSIRSNSLSFSGSELKRHFPEVFSHISQSKAYGLVVSALNAGIYYSGKLSRRSLIDAKVLPGYSIVSSTETEGLGTDHNIQLFKSELLHRFSLNLGAGFSFMVSENTALRIFGEYCMAFRQPGYRRLANDDFYNPQYIHHPAGNKYIHCFYLGGSITAVIF